MEFFDHFTSNTIAGSGNQYFFESDPRTVHCSRVFYRIAHGGDYHYSLLFSNILDSTFSDGTVSHCNLICKTWELLGARIGRCRDIASETFAPGAGQITMDETKPGSEENISAGDFTELTFEGKASKKVEPGAFFCSDPVEKSYEAGEYLCLEVTFRGSMIPYHEESILPAFVRNGQGWKQDKHGIFAAMIGCDRKAEKRVAFLGDSITQGIGVDVNSYEHWNARLAEKLPEEYACWNLGLGFGRAADAASGGAWMYKAQHNDYVVVCYGVNDIFQTGDPAGICRNLETIVDLLHKAGARVLVQLVPPFDYEGETLEAWNSINAWIRQELSQKTEAIFDPVPVLGLDQDHPQTARYGGHPNREGSKLWAEALEPVMEKFLAE